MGLIDTPGNKMEPFFQSIGGQTVNKDGFGAKGILFKGHYDGYNYTVSVSESGWILDGKVNIADPNSVNIGGVESKSSLPLYTYEIPLRKHHGQVSICQFRSVLFSVVAEVKPEGDGTLPKFKLMKDYDTYAATEQEASAFVALAQKHGFANKLGMFSMDFAYSVELLPDRLLIIVTTINEKNFKAAMALAQDIDATIPGSALPVAPMPSTPPAPTPPPAP